MAPGFTASRSKSARAYVQPHQQQQQIRVRPDPWLTVLTHIGNWGTARFPCPLFPDIRSMYAAASAPRLLSSAQYISTLGLGRRTGTDLSLVLPLILLGFIGARFLIRLSSVLCPSRFRLVPIPSPFHARSTFTYVSPVGSSTGRLVYTVIGQEFNIPLPAPVFQRLIH